MHVKILALDYDGTIASEGRVSERLWSLLRRAHAEGMVLILVTGRRLEDLPGRETFSQLCAALVVENGATVYYPDADRLVHPFGQLPERLLRRLAHAFIDIEFGHCIAATWMKYKDKVAKILFDFHTEVTLSFNKGALMILPAGATKGAGLQSALGELGYSCKNVIACGDAENDRSIFRTVDYGVAVGDASAGLRAVADLVMPEPNGKAVENLLAGMLDQRLLPGDSGAESWLSIGHGMDKFPVAISPYRLFNQSLGIFGASSSGKSWLAGLLAEGLFQKDYQVCILDPEGDYHNFRSFPRTLVLGDEHDAPPAPEIVATLLEYVRLSIIIDLSKLPIDEKVAYGNDLLKVLFALRQRRGIPHWLLLDEAQFFCPVEENEFTFLLQEYASIGGFGLVSYSPSLMSARVLEKLDNWLVLPLSEAREVAQLCLYITGENGLADTIKQLQPKQVFYYESPQPIAIEGSAGRGGQVVALHKTKRSLPHVRHLHKYLLAPLPMEKRFYYQRNSGREPATASSLWEFMEQIPKLSPSTIEYHLRKRDFERWVRDVLHDEVLAHQLHKLANRSTPQELLKEDLQDIVTRRYGELERLI